MEGCVNRSMDELISVVIPAYNVENYLSRTLDSVLAQVYENLEILVVNDGSTDGTAAVMEEYARRDSRVRGIHKENGGVTSARLRGLAEAKGQWIGFVDGDDYIEPDMYRRLAENARNHQAAISHCGYKKVFPDGRVDYYYNTGRLLLQQDFCGCTDLLDGGFVEPGLWNKLYRRELFAGLDAWIDTSIRINEDLLMNYYLFRQAKTTVFEDVCPYHYLMRRGSASTARLNAYKLKDPLKVRHILLEETKDHARQNAVAERRLMYQLVVSATIPNGGQKELIKPFRKEVRKELRNRLWQTIKGSACGTRLKIMVLWAAIWPGSYCAVHKLYSRITGVDRKYAVE